MIVSASDLRHFCLWPRQAQPRRSMKSEKVLGQSAKLEVKSAPEGLAQDFMPCKPPLARPALALDRTSYIYGQ
jgi:hypothetical protein